MSAETSAIQTGLPAPDFTLEGSAGKVTLSDYRDKQSVIVYFMREIACSACRRHAAELASSFAALQAEGVAVLVIGGGRLQDAQRMAERLALPFPVLADPERSVYRLYHLNKSLLIFQTSATFLVDKGGVLRYARRAASPYAGMDGEELRRELAKLNARPDSTEVTATQY